MLLVLSNGNASRVIGLLLNSGFEFELEFGFFNLLNANLLVQVQGPFFLGTPESCFLLCFAFLLGA
jgi:hypothetical protein